MSGYSIILPADMVEEHLRPGVVLMIDVVVDTCSKYNLEATASTVEIVGFTKEPILNTTQVTEPIIDIIYVYMCGIYSFI